MKRLLFTSVVLVTFACSAPTSDQQSTQPAEISITSKSPEAVEHFRKGRDLLENVRLAEAAAEFEEALKLDPDFALAHAYHGTATPGREGLRELEQARAQAGSLPAPERLTIELMTAFRGGENAKAADLAKQLADAAPADWRSHAALGTQLATVQKYGEAIGALQKAAELNPKAGTVHNSLGYAYLVQGEAGPAIDAFRRYAELSPGEPNPQDSLGEALLAGGQFAEAEAAFRKAAELSPGFWNAWEGVALTKFYAGDWNAGKEALARAREAASRPSDKIGLDAELAIASYAEGKAPDALKLFEAIEKSPEALRSDVALASVARALIFMDASRYKDALAETAKAIQVADSGQIAAGPASNVRVAALAARAAVEGRMGDQAAVEKTVAALEQETAARPETPQLDSALHFARGTLAAAKKDIKAAQEHFAQCSNQDAFCHWQAFLVSQRAGDQTGADAARARIVRIYRRDPAFLYARTMLNRRAGK